METHFAEAAAKGRSEAEVAARLGDPVRMARELRAEAGLKRWEQERNLRAALGAVVAVLGLATLDLFIMLPLLLVAASLLLVLIVVGASLALAGLLLLLLAFAHAVPGFSGTWLQGLLLAIGITCGGASAVATGSLLTIGAVNLLVRYARLHYRAVTPSNRSVP